MANKVRTTKPLGKPGETREAVQRMFDNDLDPRTIAQGLGISVSAVHYHLRSLKAAGEDVPAIVVSDEGAA